MPVLHLSRDQRYGRIIVERRGDDGSLTARTASRFTTAKDFSEAARQLQVDKDTLTPWVDSFQRSGDETRCHTLDATAPTFEVSLRGRLETAGDAVAFPAADPLQALRAALACDTLPEEPLLSWHGLDRLAVVDVDYHSFDWDRRLTDATADRLARSVAPTPALAWRTHGRGLRLVYAAQGDCTAGELAGAAALWLGERESSATVEIKDQSRHPGRALPNGRVAGPVVELVPDADLSAVRKWLGTGDAAEGDVDAWLEARGLERGSRYEHSECPVNPTGEDLRKPVVVQDQGVKCYQCAGLGICRGSRVAGWFPYTALVGGGASGVLRASVEGFAHWDHARHVVEAVAGLVGKVAEMAYAAALKAFHGPDPRCEEVFTAGKNLIRFAGSWVTSQGETYTKDTRRILERLPACRLAKDGQTAPCEWKVATFQQTIDLERYGYPELTPVWGLRIYGRQLPARESRVSVVLPSRALAASCYESCRPRYLRPAERELTEEKAWSKIDRVFPGVSRQLVKLLIAAKGVAEGERSMPPFTFLSGPTGAAKTGTVLVAAALCGDSTHSVTWSANEERTRQQIVRAKEQGSFVLFNEILKSGKNANKSTVQAMDYVLNLTPDSLSHKLYVGPVHLGSLPVCVWTDTDVPFELKRDQQLGRRIVHAHLPHALDWRGSIRDHGLSYITELRTLSPEIAHAADVIVSSVMDEFFDDARTYEQIAESLGFGVLSRSEEAGDARDSLRELYRQVCAAGGLSDSDRARWPGRGWKVLRRGDDGPLTSVWESVCDEDWFRSRRCEETDWGGLLGSPLPIRCEIRRHGGVLAIRFRAGGHKNYRVNEELQDGMELAAGPEEGCLFGRGDSESGGPPDGGREEVPF